jgi:hemerythrin-like domain-containing protein
MKRDARLRGLSSGHHHALVLARSLTGRQRPWTQDDGAELARRFVSELEPHFRAEEDLLLPALRRTGATALADRTIEDHAFLRSRAEAVRSGDAGAARAFGERLRDHVRFEERELFPACEKLLPDDVLEEVSRRAPHGR